MYRQLGRAANGLVIFLLLASESQAKFSVDSDDQRFTPEEWDGSGYQNFFGRLTRQASAAQCWPKATFGLLETTSGCPSGGWSKGEVRHSLKKQASVSHPNHLKTKTENGGLTLSFCMRNSEVPEERSEFNCDSSDPSFPPGSYCILNGQKANVYERCPPGFHWSAVGLDDYGRNPNGRRTGSAPTGEYFPTFTHYYFCCRNDSDPQTEIQLPTTQPFILFPINSTQKCQEVRGLKAKEIHMFLSTESESYVGFPDRKNTPYASTEIVIDGLGSCSGDRVEKGLKLHLCYYSRW
ncbi:hypothetical protein RvY_16005 [Ramazzottius varieornatus]|uniref:Apextrin C-terminal domain-containing protein n=1 Tax=Ramazzottius varieornatus TaxID=947166 RepID=A0A1D1VYC8_RAMVA|nr:hypothetical protein RvY_16005 [Ramazzottius varieornatus]